MLKKSQSWGLSSAAEPMAVLMPLSLLGYQSNIFRKHKLLRRAFAAVTARVTQLDLWPLYSRIWQAAEYGS